MPLELKQQRTPALLDGRRFEQLTQSRVDALKEQKVAHFGRYGVQCSILQTNHDGTVQAQVMSSLPDFEGVYKGGHQAIWDCKVCSQASFPLNSYRDKVGSKGKRRQLTHMLERASHGVVCFFLIHWNERALKTRTDAPFTCAFPVHPYHPFWSAFEMGEEKSINRTHCEMFAPTIEWSTWGREQIARPDVMMAITQCESRMVG